MLTPILIPSLFAILMTFWVFFKVLHIAKVKNIVDNPEARKLQKIPVPVLGGIAVFFGIICGILVSHLFFDCSAVMPIFLGMSLMIYIGAIDDIVGLTPSNRLIIEVIAILGLIYGSGACVDSLQGLWGIYQISWWVGVPLTVFAGVGIINAMNMIDGVNGLSSSLCIACCVFFGVTMLYAGDYANAMLAFVCASSLIPFLIHNVLGRKSKMFVGDAGTMTMGILMSWFVIQVLSSGHTPQLHAYVTHHQLGLVALTLAVLSVPVADTLRVMARRIMHGHSPFQADKTHLHHMLINYSQSHSLTTIAEVTIALLIVLIWFVAYRLGLSIDAQFYVVLCSAIVLVWGLYAYLSYNHKRNTRLAFSLRRTLGRGRQGHKRWWQRLQTFIDTPRLRSGDTIDWLD